MKQLILLSNNTLAERVTEHGKYLCVDYDTLELNEVTSTDIIHTIDKKKESYLGLDYNWNEDTVRIVESTLPIGKYQGDGYKVMCEAHRLIIETDDRYVFRLDIKDNTLRFMSQAVVSEVGGAKIPTFNYRWFYIKDGILHLSMYIISYIIEIRIQDKQVLVDVADTTLYSKLWSIQEYINQIYN